MVYLTSLTAAFLAATVSVSAVPLIARQAAQSFTRQNGLDAQAQNAASASLSPNSPCTAGQTACINNAFSQCVDSKFVSAGPCAGGLICAVLPLVNNPGTSLACTTRADAEARIKATGVTGGLTGTGGANPPAAAPPAAPSAAVNNAQAPANPPPAQASPAPAAAPPPPAAAPPNGFAADNGKAAQALNAKFAGLNANSPCTDGEEACIANKDFAQCVGGKFVTTPCAPGCFALPLVNKPGTSITCAAEADAAQRIANTGVPGGVRG